MLTPNQLAQQIFEVLCFSIDQACVEQDWFNVRRDAMAYGFTQTDASSTSAYTQRFELKIEPDFQLNLSYRSSDPSGPFQTLPAISRFELTLSFKNEVLQSHQNGYDEPVIYKDKAIWNELSFA